MGIPVEINNLMLGSLGGYTVGRSLRFRSSASAYLNRTPASAGNRQKFTWSGWVKRGTLGASAGSIIFSAYNGAANQDLYLAFGSTTGTGTADTLNLFAPPAGNNVNVVSAGVYRDTSAWYHIVCAVDTTQATAANRVRLYVNGSEISYGSSSYPSLNQSLSINSTNQHTIGVNGGVTSWGYLDGYLGEINFVDGQQLTPSSFGAYDTNGVWQPKKYSGTYGTNGFYLPFSDNSALTTASNVGLGKDFSGNGNYWVTNNISITAGTTYDSMIDSPTVSVSSSNYPIINPLLGGVTGGASYTISQGNLYNVMSAPSTNYLEMPANMQLPTSGKWYWETTVISVSTTFAYGGSIGISDQGIIGNGTTPVFTNNYYYYLAKTGNKYSNNTSTAYGATYTANDIISVAFDADNGTLTFYKNNVSQGTAFTGLTAGPYFPKWGTNDSMTFAVNFGQRPFTYTPPTGFNALNTYNLPAPSIANGAQYMAATTFTGNASTNTINNGTNTTIGTSFQPDMVWLKSRSNANNHTLYDSIRGINDILYTNLTNAAVNSANNLTSFNSNGYTLGANENSNDNSGESSIGWSWKAGGTGVSNTSGTITSTVSANPSAGFSVVTFTANGTSGATVGHGLGVAPNLILGKNRSNVANWNVYHSDLGATKYLELNTTVAAGTSSAAWNNTAPTSTLVTLGGSAGAINTTGTAVLYCFAAVRGFSAFGSYTGNGSADGTFVYLGFRPRWVMIKRTDTTGAWNIFDTSLNPYNLSTQSLVANTSAAENTGTTIILDIMSNGIKMRSTDAALNSGTLIYAAFAEVPYNFARAR